MRDLSGREPQVAEDDILDARPQQVPAERHGFRRVLVEEVEDHREVVDPERPERVLVLADHAEVLPVSVDHQDVAERAFVDELLELLYAGVIEQQVAGHQDDAALFCDRDELVDLRGLHRRRLLDEDVLAGLERLLRELVVRWNGRRDDDGVELGVCEHLVERGGPPGLWVAAAELRLLALRRIGQPRELGQIGEVAREVLPPLTQAGLADAKGHSFQTLSERRPLEPVAFRRSTTSTDSSTSAL